MEKYAIYLRKSRADLELEKLGEGETLARHKTALLDLAKRQQLDIVEIYEEIVSGESIAGRPQMQRLLEDVWDGKYRGVLVMEVERLARGNTKDQGEVSEAFAATKTLIVTPSKTYDPTNEFDQEYFEFGLFMSRMEYKTIRRRLERGKMASMREGNYIAAHPPYGYDIVRPDKHTRTLVPNEKAEYVKLIFDLCLEGLSNYKIAKRMRELGIPTPAGGDEWTNAGVERIIHNDVYIGKVRWGKRRITKIQGSAQQKRTAPEDQLVFDGKHPAIVDLETFARASAISTTCAPLRHDVVMANPFARLLMCAKCGRTMRRNTKKGVSPRFVHAVTGKCMVKSAKVDEVKSALLVALRRTVANFCIEVNNYAEKNTATLLESFQKELRREETKREKLFDLLESGAYTTEEFLERKELSNQRIQKLKDSIDGLNAEMPSVDEIKNAITDFNRVIETLEDASASPEQQNKMLRSILSKIEYDCIDLGRRKGGEIILKLTFRERYSAFVSS